MHCWVNEASNTSSLHLFTNNKQYWLFLHFLCHTYQMHLWNLQKSRKKLTWKVGCRLFSRNVTMRTKNRSRGPPDGMAARKFRDPHLRRRKVWLSDNSLLGNWRNSSPDANITAPCPAVIILAAAILWREARRAGFWDSKVRRVPPRPYTTKYCMSTSVGPLGRGVRERKASSIRHSAHTAASRPLSVS